MAGLLTFVFALCGKQKIKLKFKKRKVKKPQQKEVFLQKELKSF
jgi:hypothetical protein